MKKSIRIGTRTIPVWLFIAVGIAAVAVASAIIGTIYIGYRITPTVEAPTMTPGTLNLDLGTIPSGSTGTKDFGKVATLDLPAGYEITFTLDTATVPDFITFSVSVYLYKPGETYWTYYFYFSKIEFSNYDSEIVDTGTYDVRVEISYTAMSVTVETTGTVKIEVSYPG